MDEYTISVKLKPGSKYKLKRSRHKRIVEECKMCRGKGKVNAIIKETGKEIVLKCEECNGKGNKVKFEREVFWDELYLVKIIIWDDGEKYYCFSKDENSYNEDYFIEFSESDINNLIKDEEIYEI